MIKVYLSGASKCEKDEGYEWRKAAEEYLSTYRIFNPNEHYNYSTLIPESNKECMRLFLHHLDDSQIVLVNLDNSNASVGTGIEIGYALANNKVIIGFGVKNIYGWIVEACDYVANTLAEAAEYITLHY